MRPDVLYLVQRRQEMNRWADILGLDFKTTKVRTPADGYDRFMGYRAGTVVIALGGLRRVFEGALPNNKSEIMNVLYANRFTILELKEFE